jgi:uncharacterized delta-60 repeat protein
VTSSFSGQGDQAFAVAIQPGGQIVAAGSTFNGSNLDFALAEYNANGTPYTPFNGTGTVTTDFAGGDDQAFGLAIQADGKIVAAGQATGLSTGSDFALARYNPNGSLDTSSFGGGTGLVTTDFAGSDDQARAVAIQVDGRILLGGFAFNGTSRYDFALARYNTDGSLDTSFGPAATGTVTTDFAGSTDQALALGLQANGNIVAAGYSVHGNEGQVVALARYLGTSTTSVVLDGSGNLTVTDVSPNGKDDDLILSLNGSNLRIHDPINPLAVGSGFTQIDSYTVEVPLAAITGVFQINTRGGNDRIVMDGAQAGSIDGGTGTNTLDYSNLSGPVTVNLATGSASDLSGTFSNITHFVGSGGSDTLIGANTSNTWAVTGGTNSGVVNGTFTFSGFENLTGGTQDDTLSVSFANGVPQVPGPMFFDGGPGSNTLTIDAAGLSVKAVPGSFTVGDPQTISFGNVQSAQLNNASAVNIMPGPNTADRATAFTGLSANERFVQALYLDSLGRAGSKAELDGWAALITGQDGSLALVASAIEHSPEARDRQVRSWYQTFLGRNAAPGEEMGWVNFLLNGATEEQALSLFLAGGEFYQRAQTLVSSGTPDERYAQALYMLLLDRTGSAQEVAGQVSALPAAGLTGVALGFLQSVEFRADLVTAYYTVLLHRPADMGSLSAWATSGLDATSMQVGIESVPPFEFNSNG